MCFSPRCKDPHPPVCRGSPPPNPSPLFGVLFLLPAVGEIGSLLGGGTRSAAPSPVLGGLRPLESRTAAASHVGWTVAPCCLHRDPVAGVLGPRLQWEEGVWALLGREVRAWSPSAAQPPSATAWSWEAMAEGSRGAGILYGVGTQGCLDKEQFVPVGWPWLGTALARANGIWGPGSGWV